MELSGSGGLAKMHKISSHADRLTKETHFNTEECKVLLYIYERMIVIGAMDRLRFREILHTTFDIADDVMLDLCFRSFDRDNDGIVNESEWVRGLSIMLRGEIEELIEFCYFVYDMNGDGSLAREELIHCLKGCIVSGYGVDADETDECEREIVEIAMKQLDVDHDGQVTFPDFQNAVFKDPLLLQAIGPCLPSSKSMAAFLSLVTDRYRKYTDCYGRNWVRRGSQKHSRKSVRHFMLGSTGGGPGGAGSNLAMARKSVTSRKQSTVSLRPKKSTKA